jgi:hypothetical protein
MATQTEERRLAFLATALPPIVCVVVFFLAPLAIVWAYSFGQNVSLTEVDISGTFANYVRALQPLYLGIFVKSVFVAGLTTLLCLIIGFPVALAIVFASERWRPWMLLLIMLPFWTNLARQIPHRGESRSWRRSSSHAVVDRGAACAAWHHLRDHHHLRAGAWSLSYPRSSRWPGQPDDRQHHRTPSQEGQ